MGPPEHVQQHDHEERTRSRCRGPATATSGRRTLSRTPVDVDRVDARPATITAPSSPPISAWLDELGMPSRHVSRFQTIAPTSAAATIDLALRRRPASSASPDAIVLATAVPVSAPTKFAVADMRIACSGLRARVDDRRRDRVGGVVEAVDVVEDDGQARGRRSAAGSAVWHGRRLAGRGPARARRRGGPPAGRPAAILRAMRLSQLFFTTLRDDPADAEMPSHRLLAPGRLRPPARVRDLLAAAARQAGQRPGRADHPRGAGPDRRPGDGDAGRPPGRHLAGERPLRRDRAGADPVQGPHRARHGPRDDPRGGRRRSCSRDIVQSRTASCR